MKAATDPPAPAGIDRAREASDQSSATPGRPPAGSLRWRPWSAPLALIAGFAAAVVGALIVGVVGSVAGASVNHPPPSVQIIDTIVQDGALVFAAIMFAHSYGRTRPADFGLVRPPMIWFAIGLTLGYAVEFVEFLYGWGALLDLHAKEKIIDQLGANQSVAAAVAVALLVSVIAPFAEEFVFRGYFFGALRNWRGPWPAAVLTGIVFGAIHAGSAPAGYLVPLAFFGFVLCLLRWQTGSLYPGIVLHSLNNSVALGAGLNWDWQIPVLIVGALVILGTGALVVDRTFARPAVAQ